MHLFGAMLQVLKIHQWAIWLHAMGGAMDPKLERVNSVENLKRQ